MVVCKGCTCLIFILLILKVNCYEKTLRKIVRSQSKMIHRPFSEVRSRTLNYSKTKTEPSIELMFPLYNNQKKKLHKLQRPKISSFLSSVDIGSYLKTRISEANQSTMGLSGVRHNIPLAESRMARNTVNNSMTTAIFHSSPSTTENVLFCGPEVRNNPYPNKTSSEEIAVESFYEIPQPPRVSSKSKPVTTKYQRPSAIKETQLSEPKQMLLIPQNDVAYDNKSSILKSIFLPNAELKKKQENLPTTEMAVDIDSNKVDFYIQGKRIEGNKAIYSYNVTTNKYQCNSILKANADMDAQEMFTKLEIEPSWAKNRMYWNSIFETRYESLMRSSKWPPLQAILVPRTQVFTTWKRTFERYHNDTVHRILSNVVKKMQFYRNLTFSWNEVSHLSQWWKTTSSKSRSAFRRLLKSGRLEITTGGFVESDEATSHIFGLIHQLMEGQLWLKNILNYTPEVAWLTSSVTHSPTMTYLLSASGISNLVTTHFHYAWEEYLAEYQHSDFVWIQKWKSDNYNLQLNHFLGKIGNDRLPQNAVMTHFLQFNSDGFTACGPNRTICLDLYDFVRSNQNPHVNTFNVKERAEKLLEQYSKTGTLSKHNVVLAPLGGPLHYEKHSDFDFQYSNYEKLAEYINVNRDIYKATIEFGVAKDYFKNVLNKKHSFPTWTGDFINFADLNDGNPAYWTGYYTSRPWFKILLRRLQSTIRSTEILLTFTVNFNTIRGFDPSNLYKTLSNVREQYARLQDRHVISGTLTANTLKQVYKEILTTVKNCWHIQEICASLLSLKPDKNIQMPYLEKYVYREGEFISVFRVISAGDQIYIFNSLSHERTEAVELIVRDPNIRIIDHNKKEVTMQINPIWKYNSDNFLRLSKLFYKVTFVIVIPPLTLELYKIRETYDSSQYAATVYCMSCFADDIPSEGHAVPFTVLPIDPGDIQLESYNHRLIFDEQTGFLRTVVDKLTNEELMVTVDYGAFKSSSKSAGVFLFNTNVTKPLKDVLKAYRIGLKSKVIIIISGQILTEITTIYGRLLQSTVRVFNMLQSPLSRVISIESKVEFESSPKNREVELFLSIQTSISNGNPPEIITDSNGFQYITRTLNMSRRIESNMYPMTTLAFIQDHRNRMTVITDHAQGVTALQEGQIVIMLDRRVLFNDGRGSNEGIADSTATYHRHLILLESVTSETFVRGPGQEILQWPSLMAVHLVNSFDNKLDVFRIDKEKSEFCYYGFLPLIKMSFPCDVTLINFRINFNKGSLALQAPHSALMVLHREAVTCLTQNEQHSLAEMHCSGSSNLVIDRILHKVTSIHKTNLCGTNEGIPLSTLNLVQFPPMEIATLKIVFK